MRSAYLLFLFRALACSIIILPAAAEIPTLAWDAEQKEYTAKPGEESATLRFHLKNISSAEVTINKVTTSCGCTVATIPREPWVLQPGEEGDVSAVVDLRGKSGTVGKTLFVQMPGATHNLGIVVHLPDPLKNPFRLANLAAAKVDRQAVFKGKCASCHADPLKEKTGALLYIAACEICHQADKRASMVPSIEESTKGPRTEEFWRQWIAKGKAGTLMPAFSREQGGPLTSVQIESLVRFLSVPAGKS